MHCLSTSKLETLHPEAKDEMHAASISFPFKWDYRYVSASAGPFLFTAESRNYLFRAERSAFICLCDYAVHLVYSTATR